jgi:hypothetical protein
MTEESSRNFRIPFLWPELEALQITTQEFLLFNCLPRYYKINKTTNLATYASFLVLPVAKDIHPKSLTLENREFDIRNV